MKHTLKRIVFRDRNHARLQYLPRGHSWAAAYTCSTPFGPSQSPTTVEPEPKRTEYTLLCSKVGFGNNSAQFSAGIEDRTPPMAGSSMRFFDILQDISS